MVEDVGGLGAGDGGECGAVLGGVFFAAIEGYGVRVPGGDDGGFRGG